MKVLRERIALASQQLDALPLMDDEPLQAAAGTGNKPSKADSRSSPGEAPEAQAVAATPAAVAAAAATSKPRREGATRRRHPSPPALHQTRAETGLEGEGDDKASEVGEERPVSAAHLQRQLQRERHRDQLRTETESRAGSRQAALLKPRALLTRGNSAGSRSGSQDGRSRGSSGRRRCASGGAGAAQSKSAEAPDPPQLTAHALEPLVADALSLLERIRLIEPEAELPPPSDGSHDHSRHPERWRSSFHAVGSSGRALPHHRPPSNNSNNKNSSAATIVPSSCS